MTNLPLTKLLRPHFFIFIVLSFTVFFLPSYAALIVEPDNIELGDVQREVGLKKYILIKNGGVKPIKIVGIVNQCGINFSVVKRDLAVGEVTEGVVAFYSSTAIGQFREKIIIAYQAQDEPLKESHIVVSWHTKPSIYTDIHISPKTFDFGKVPLNKPINFEIEIINKGTSKGAITIVKRDTGIDLPNNVEVQAGERKIIKGTISPSEVGKLKKTVMFEIKDFTSPLEEIVFNYEAHQDIIEGTYIELKNVEKYNDIYKIPVIVTNGNQDVQFISVETPEGEKLKISEKQPFYIFKNEKKEFYLLINIQDYERLKNSYYYFTFGIKTK